MPTNSEVSPGGWAVFAGVVLLLIGCFNVIFGLTAIFNDEVLRVSSRGLIVWDFTAWGWIHLVVGGIMVVVSFGLFAVRDWARWLAIFFASLNAIAQAAFITVFPIWSVLVIVLDVLVIYHLATRPWEQAS